MFHILIYDFHWSSFFELRRQCRIHLLFFEVCQLKHLLKIWRNISKVMVVLHSNIRPLVWSCCFAFAGSRPSVSGFWTSPPPPSCPAPEEQVAAKHGKVSPLLYLKIFIVSLTPAISRNIYFLTPAMSQNVYILTPAALLILANASSTSSTSSHSLITSP